MHIAPNNGSARLYAAGNELWEYLLVAYPDETVSRKLEEEKALIGGAYEAEMQPHIGIAAFQAKEAMEGTLVRWIQNICHLHPGFTVTLNNFSGFPPHTIYLRIQDPLPLLQLSHRLKILDGFVQSNDCPPLQLAARPHLALGSLPEAAYTAAVREVAQRSFHASFQVNKLVLVRKWWEGGRYELVNTFNLPQG